MAMSSEQLEIVRSIGNRIKELRSERGWSQEKLAHKAETSLATVRRLEQGSRMGNLESLEKFARAFEVPLRELFSFELAPSRTGVAA